MTIVDELLRGGASARPPPPAPARSGPRDGSDPSRRETGGGQRRVRCPACGFEQSGDPSSCRRCGNRLREPSRATRVAAVLGESDDGDVLEALGLDEDDLRESLDAADVAPRRSGPDRGDSRRERVEAAAAWAAKLKGYGASPERIAEILREGNPKTDAEVDRALRVAEVEGYAPADGDDLAEGDDLGDGAVTLEDGLDDWLDDRFGGSA